jgi:hypothetical protein
LPLVRAVIQLLTVRGVTSQISGDFDLAEAEPFQPCRTFPANPSSDVHRDMRVRSCWRVRFLVTHVYPAIFVPFFSNLIFNPKLHRRKT